MGSALRGETPLGGLVDACLLVGPPALYVLVFLTPSEARLALTLSHTAPSYYALYTSHFVHFTTAHLVANVVGYLIATTVGYLLARTAGARMVVTPGNHDSMLTTLWDGPAPAEHRLDDGTVVLHGHEAPEADASLYIVGPDHPTIEIEGQRRPCYLHGPTAAGPGEAIVLMVPSFTRLAAGVAVNEMRTGAFQSPLVTEADLLRPLVRDEPADETLAFPPLGRFRELL